MRYIILIYESPQDLESRDLENIDSRRYCSIAWRNWLDALLEADVFESMQYLLPEHTATTIRIRDRKRLLHDGPYADTKEQLGSCFVIDVLNLDEALQWAERCPAASAGAVEVRPLRHGDTPCG